MYNKFNQKEDIIMSKYGELAEACGKKLALKVMRSNAGFYIGTSDEEGYPFSRESVEYFKKEGEAVNALATDSWTQKEYP